MSSSPSATLERPRIAPAMQPGGTAPAAVRAPITTVARPPRRTPVTAADLSIAACSHYGPPVAILVGLVFWPAGMLVALIPIAILLTAGSRSAYVAAQATESLNFVLTWILGWGAVVIVQAVTAFPLGWLVLPLALIYWVFQTVMFVKAGTAARKGRLFRYPATLRLVK